MVFERRVIRAVAEMQRKNIWTIEACEEPVYLQIFKKKHLSLTLAPFEVIKVACAR